jgi:hypothetical protein
MPARKCSVRYGKITAWIAAKYVLDRFEADCTSIPGTFHHDQSRHGEMIAYRRLESRLPGFATVNEPDPGRPVLYNQRT